MINIDKLGLLIEKHEKMDNFALYDERMHSAKAKIYSDGELAYWKKQRDWFVDKFGGTFWGLKWIRENCPDLKETDFIAEAIAATNRIIERSNDEEAFWIKQADRFFMYYFPYQRINEIIGSLSLKGTELSDFSKEDFKKLLRSNMKDEEKEELTRTIQVQLNANKEKYSIVAVADILYKHRQQIFNQLGKPTEFKRWMTDFCKYFGITEVPTAKPSNKKVKDQYNILGRNAFAKWCPEMKKKTDDRFSSHY
ncbi:MAG: hypothetical protein PHI28_04335 [Mangrovibacterium sp.]|nr:hypothetical protein [Mangrovibacterium sp.]